MSGDLLIRPLVVDDLPQYKALRDTMLALHPEAFTSDAASERARPASSYAPRVGADRPEGGQFTLGAWLAGELVGAVSCEREPRVKVRHVAHLTGLMVRPQDRGQGIGRMLLVTCIERARAVRGLEMLTLSVTATNTMASALYAKLGFRRYGTLPRALKVDGEYHDKDLMVLDLN
jgi:ribosomal protein S18 acetylase RimI-like enzyme